MNFLYILISHIDFNLFTLHIYKKSFKKPFTNKLCTLHIHSLLDKLIHLFYRCWNSDYNSILIRSQITHNARMLFFHNLLRKCNFSHKSWKHLFMLKNVSINYFELMNNLWNGGRFYFRYKSWMQKLLSWSYVIRYCAVCYSEMQKKKERKKPTTKVFPRL